MIRIFILTLSVVLIIGGLIVFWLPIPLGLIMMATGSYLLIGHSETFRHFFKMRRRKNPKFNSWLISISPKLPERIIRQLEKTDPQ